MKSKIAPTASAKCWAVVAAGYLHHARNGKTEIEKETILHAYIFSILCELNVFVELNAYQLPDEDIHVPMHLYLCTDTVHMEIVDVDVMCLGWLLKPFFPVCCRYGDMDGILALLFVRIEWWMGRIGRMGNGEWWMSIVEWPEFLTRTQKYAIVNWYTQSYALAPARDWNAKVRRKKKKKRKNEEKNCCTTYNDGTMWFYSQFFIVAVDAAV